MIDLSEYRLETIRKDDEFVLYSGRQIDATASSIFVLTPASEHPAVASLKRMEHEYSLQAELDPDWAVIPIGLVKHDGRTMLVLANSGGDPLDRFIGTPMELRQFLRLAIGLSAALGRLHERGLVHKDIKPSNVFINSATGQVWLTGFCIASRLLREHQAPEPPEFIAGTLPYMAPEQTGRMNRSIDSRSDLYTFGVTLYEMLTGDLPFSASDPMEWVHCHVARQPVPPGERLPGVPGSVSAIIMKLLAKTAEERYQTAAGAESDLRRCLAEWKTQGRIDEFALGEHDIPDRLLIPEKLYGRASEIETLLTSFDRVVAGGRPELILVSGYSGIGKSAVVNELHKPLVPPRGLFASGKFDQYKRDIPYATLAQAFQSLIRPLLSKPEAELRRWRDALVEALDPNALLIVDLVPELKHIIGEQPPVPELPPQEAQGRFQLVFRRFISVFARPEHPLALFLDDLQWLDAATLDLLEHLLTRPDVQHLLLIGAYRDNEVDPTHPLIRKLEAMGQAGAVLQNIVLAPLTREDLGRLIADSLHCECERVMPLAQLIHQKTSGNPFFAIQFITALAEEALLTFDYGAARWSWDLDRIHAKGYTDNVVDLMVGKLNRLPVETQKALQQLACMGNSAEFSMLGMVYQDSREEMHDQLWEAVRAGLVFRAEDSYRFLHDRVQEAAYSLIPEELRAEAHLRIGRLLAAHTPPERLEEGIFEIVNQLNRGSHLVTSAEERERVAELNFVAGNRAKTSTAYASALRLLAAGRELLTEKTWDCNYDLIFKIEYLMAECELLTADMVAAENRLSMLAQRAKGGHDIAVVTRLRLTLYTTLDRSDRGVELYLEYLRRLGTDWSSTPTRDEVMREYGRIWSLVGNRQIEELIELPLMTDPDILDVLDVLTEAVTPSMYCDENLFSLVICHMVNLSLEHGNCDASCFAYVWFAVIAGPRFGKYKEGYRFGRLGYELVEKRGLIRYQARTYMSFGNMVIPWARHALEGRELARRAFDAAYRIGDLTFAAYSWTKLITNFLMVGDPLAEIQPEAEKGLAFAQRAQFGLVADLLIPQVGIIRILRGLTPKFGSFDDEQFDELQFERHLASNPTFALPEFWYCLRKAQARFLAGDYATAVDASLRAQQLLYTSPSQLETAESRFYGALSHAAAWDSAPPDQRQQHFEALTDHHRQLEIWAGNCPENFENRAALVGAEIARIEGRETDAAHLYEQAIRSAHANGFVHNEAIAYEVAARFYSARGFDKFADAYLREARYCYVRWGADGKVRQLDDLYPGLTEERRAISPNIMIGTPIENLDLGTVIKISQAVSGEMDLDKLITTLMLTAIEHAGASRGLLILLRGDEQRIEAEAVTNAETVIVRRTEAAFHALPQSIANYVIRTKQFIILNDASGQNSFSADPYIAQYHPRSLLCLPLINQGKLIGVLYFENNLAPNVFTQTRTAVLKLVASQAAISLENTRLYADLAEREAKIRRLVDANIIGVCIWNLEGRIIEANEAFLRTVGYGREDILSGRVSWREVTPDKWCEADEQALEELAATGVCTPFEKEYFRKDGSRVPVLVGGALSEGSGNEGVAFVLDLTERKRAEEALRQSETQFRTLAETASDAIIMIDAMGAIIFVNPPAEKVFGRPAAEMIGENLTMLMPEYMRRLHQAGFERYRQTGRRHIPWQAVELPGLHRDGHEIPLEISFAEFSSNGRRYFTGIVRDISERKRAEETLREQASLLSLTHDAIFVCHMNGVLKYWNRGAQELYGWTAEEAMGNVTHDLLKTIFPIAREEIAAEVMHTGRWEGELVQAKKDGRQIVVASRWSLQRDETGAPVGFLETNNDITERKQAEEERERLRRELGHFAHLNRVSTMGELTASLAHEINQPLAAIVTNAQVCLRWLRRDVPNLEEVRGAADLIARDGKRASDVISRIRALVRKTGSEKAPLDINQAIEEVVHLTEEEALRKGVVLRTELAGDLPFVLGDRVQLQQVLLNLILNGVEAMSAVADGPRELLVYSRLHESNHVLVVVQDSGIGIEPENLKKVFAPFYTTKSQGMGMGLAISRSIVENHGGKLWASPNDGPGATFKFTL